ncbi:two-component sensor histidine kinase [Rhizocola hellebori]|uniref:histidine kinase n=1 Tax=Rhizocola hellebori TaxID=1392758 RepID=A0A8J3VGB5_9ACTN|nr:histidine kinase [Rhizocola hellebori]GIH04708.1 two-component sensor histidine kinase [Rhizocola hellebori]
MSRNFSRFEAFAPVIAGVTVFLLSFLSPQRSPISDASSSCWRTCAEEPLIASWKVIPIAAACGIAVALARRIRAPLYVMAAVGWLTFGMWAVVIVASFYAGLKFGPLAKALFVGLAVLVIATVVFTSEGSSGGLWRGSVVYVISAIGMMIVLPLIFGLWTKGRREQQAEAERMQALKIRESERNRIAREMHDIVAHRVSLIVIHAGALEMGARDEPTSRTAGLIRSAGREALIELRQVLGVLRGTAAAIPMPDIAGIHQLSKLSRQAGLTIDLHLQEETRNASAAAQRTAYRLVQEALTNVVKHAPGAAVKISVICPRDTLNINVRNGAPETISEPIPGSGLGLAGLSERVRALGGTFESGPTADGGFEIHAEIPRYAADAKESGRQ